MKPLILSQDCRSKVPVFLCLCVQSLVDGLQIQVRAEKKRLLAEISEVTKKAINLVQKRYECTLAS